MQGTYDVAVVGYGPVGQVLAVLLGQRGWSVGVFEKQPLPYPLPRAAHFDHEIARILQALGLGDELPALTEPADTYEWFSADGRTLLRIGTDGIGSSGWPEANMFSQPTLEQAIDRRARKLRSIHIERGCEVTALRQDGSGVELDVRSGDGARRTARARYVVGCDGANSFVRSCLQTGVTDLGFFFDWLIVDVIPHQERTWTPINAQICDPERPTTVISGGPGRRRWEFMKLPHESIDDLNNERTAWKLLEPWDIRPDNATLERHAVYRFQARWVDTWRKGRLFVAGDAAHQMPPFAGQGMCAGMRDATNLAWKLDLVLAGKAADSILDTYQAERIPQVRQVIDLSIELGRVICVADPEEAAARDEAMAGAVAAGHVAPPLPSPTIGEGITNPGDGAAGQLFPQGRVRCGGRSGLFDDVVGRGFLLMSAAADPAALLDRDTLAYFESIGGFCVHVAPGAQVDDCDGTYEQWFRDRAAALVLVRPDFHVFGSAVSTDAARSLVTSLRHALG